MQKYPPKSAARLMTDRVPVVSDSQSITQVRELLSSTGHDFEAVYYIYVVDHSKKLVGVVSVKDVLILPESKLVKDVMTRDLITVHPTTHQERVVRLAIKNKLKAIPVINSDGNFLGVITSHVILNILHEENTEDFLRSAGINTTDIPSRDLIHASIWQYYLKRLPWLIIGLLGGVMAASVIGIFEELITEVILLASFIPMIVYIADAVGSQAQTIYIRSITIESDLRFKDYFSRELATAFALSITLGAIVSIIIGLLWREPLMALIVGTSFIFTIIVASAVALFMPWLFYRLKYDPAIASGPFATVIRDILTIFIYFSIARLVFFLF